MRAGLMAGLVLASACAYAQTNPAARPNRAITELGGNWNGSHLEIRNGCRSTQNNGFHGTYGEYRIRVDPVARLVSLDEFGVTGLTCTWSGNYGEEAGRSTWSGNLTCSDGRAGTFTLKSFLVSLTQMQLQLSIQLTGTESCAIDAILAGARFPP